MRLGDPYQDGILPDRRVALSEWTPGLQHRAVLGHQLLHLDLLVVGVGLPLIDGRDDSRVGHEVQVAVRVEVRDADGPHQTL